MSHSPAPDASGWWASLNHGGMLIAPSRLASAFSEGADALPEWTVNRLRRDVLRARKGNADSASALLDTLLEDIVGLDVKQWVKGAGVPKEQACKSNTGETLKPARLWRGDHGASLAVFYPEQASGGLSVSAGYRLGIGRGRRAVVRVVEWLRKTGQQVALLATYRQLRLIHAGADYEAFCEWDADLWFHEGAPGPQVQALRLLLSTEALTPKESGRESPLLGAINDSRRGQSELSAALGERVRRAVEGLIQASGPRLLPLMDDGPRRVEERDIYLAATRMIMRCVVILFAEARELLPQTHPIYAQSYGLNALRVELERHSTERLRTGFGAWPRLVGLFSLMFNGSEHEALPLLRYGGGLFEPGNAQSKDAVMRSIAAFEQAELRDADVQHILELITRCPTRVPQGKGWSTVQTPVDFSALGSEYLGILYEGLLDYELKRVGEGEAVIFLGIGSEPALPFALLDGMSNADLADLLKKLGKATKAEAEEDEGEDAAAGSDDGRSEHTEDEEERVAGLEAETHDSRGELRDAVQAWAERAVKAAKLVPVPSRGQQARHREAYELKVSQRARTLVRGLFLPGDWYLVRWGGTRKGAGTFYTRPQLVVPIVQRTLAPLCFEPAVAGQAPRPRKPEEILALKVCDPAMGSGSFIVAALRYLTSVLLQSLYAHERLSQHGERWHIRLADGLPLDDVTQESLPVPKDDSNLDDLLRARLKRHVVERCLYGVDLDALAVELARTALWVETMDYQLPFGFLDHKLKCGNSLVGAWLDRFEDYPIRAWDREGGDAKHPNFVQHFRTVKGKRRGDIWNATLKQHREDAILPVLRSELTQLAADAAGQLRLGFEAKGQDVRALQAEALAVMQELHDIIPIFDAERRAEVYSTKILDNTAFEALRRALDTWCAVWFWPSDALDTAPTPRDLLRPRAATRAEVDRIARSVRFFHWELEFPDVMIGPHGGFSAVIGNPPWETQKPNSMEFFSIVDPLYRTYGKQEALRRQSTYFEDRAGVEDRWMRYNAHFKALSNWTKHAAFPFGAEGALGVPLAGIDPHLQAVWRERRAGRASFSDREHPFRHQGSADINTYKMFLEVAHALLRKGGGFGFLVPSGLYTDNGTQALRSLLLDRCDWTHLYAFQNERYVFEGIHHSFKMAVVHAQKGSHTTALRTRFRLGPGDSPEASEVEEDLSDDARFLSLPSERIKRFSPTTRSILEVRSERDLRVLEKLYTNGVLLGDESPDGWGITYATEFHMTNDSALFPPRPEWEAKGYKADEYGHWLKGPWKKSDGKSRGGRRAWDVVRSATGTEVVEVSTIEDVALPLYQGIMMHQFDFARRGWVSGTGLTAVWEDVDALARHPRPQYLLGRSELGVSQDPNNGKVAFRDIARSTDERTWIATALPGFPCGNSLGVLTVRNGTNFGLASVINSFAMDAAVRERVSGTHLNLYTIAELPLVRPSRASCVESFARRLNGASTSYAKQWPKDRAFSWRRLWAVTPHERLRLRAIVDAAVADLYGLDEDDFRWILRECDHPIDVISQSSFARTLPPKGFWRVEKEKAPELRHPVLALAAFVELKNVGLDKFLGLNNGDGWQLPETLRLADYDLGHDARAKERQPVASALGDRFLPWQLNEDVAASWDECQRHAELIERIVPSKTRSVPPPSTLAPLSKAVLRATPARPLVKTLPAKRKRARQKA